MCTLPRMSIRHFVCSIFFILMACSPLLCADKPTQEEIVTKHLQAIGDAEARKAPDGREFDGAAMTRMIVGGTGGLQGTGRILSHGQELRVEMHFNFVSYPGEDFLYTGSGKPIIAEIQPGSRSLLGSYLEVHPDILRDGLFGGILTTAWPLLDFEKTGAKLKFEGTKKINGHQLYEVAYLPQKQSGDVKIFLYFEPETFRHIMTRYTSVAPYGSSRNIANPGGRNLILNVTETFSEFHLVNGLSLPLRWNIRYEQQEGSVSEWELDLQKAKLGVEDAEFQAKP